jgi:hypothetical protein
MIRSKRALEAMEEKFTQYPTQSTPSTVSITPAEALELMICAQSFEYFAKSYLKLRHPIQGNIPFEIKPYQSKVSNAWQKNYAVITVAPRQSGMTSVPLAMLLWDAVFNSGHLNVFAASANTNAGSWNMLREWVSDLPAWLNPGIVSMNRDAIQFKNGSKIRSTRINGNACRGMSISNLFVDNMAWAPEKDQEDFWYSAAPTLMCGGRVLLTGTPHGNKNMFAQIWNNALMGTNTFVTVKIAGFEAHTLKHLQDMANMLGQDQYMREYEGSFA